MDTTIEEALLAICPAPLRAAVRSELGRTQTLVGDPSTAVDDARSRVVERNARETFKLSCESSSAGTYLALGMLPAFGRGVVARNAARWECPSLDEANRTLRLSYLGRNTPIQLTLELADGPDPSNDFVKMLLKQWGEDGLRNYLVTLAMSSEQGATGDFRWTWEQHRALAGYAERHSRRRTMKDSDLLALVHADLRRLKHTEVHIELTRGPFKAWRRVGDFGIIDVLGGASLVGSADTMQRMRQNSALYRGARAGGKSYFIPVPTSALKLPRGSLTVYTAIAMSARTNKPDGEHLSNCLGFGQHTAERLWRMLELTEARVSDRRRWPDLKARADDRLAEIAERTDMRLHRYDHRDGHNAVYTFELPGVIDRLHHKLEPKLAPSTIASPLTGVELRLARADAGMSLRRLGAALGVDKSAIDRLERSGADLPPELVHKLAELKLRTTGAGLPLAA
jgi:hypothetical protein